MNYQEFVILFNIVIVVVLLLLLLLLVLQEFVIKVKAEEISSTER
jgi:hypothetical protein